MKIKISILLAVLFICSDFVYSQVPVSTKSKSGIINVKPSKNTSSIVRSSVYDDKSIDDYTEQISALEQRLEIDPQNIQDIISILRIFNIANTPEKGFPYIRRLWNIDFNKRPHKYEELKSEKNIAELKALNDELLKLLDYSKDKSSIYINLAVLNLILNNKNKAISYIQSAIINCTNRENLKITFNLIYSHKYYEDLVNVCNRYLLYVDNKDNDIQTLKFISLVKSGNIGAAIEEYESLDYELGIGPKQLLYTALKEKSKSDKEIMKIMFGKYPEPEGYYLLYRVIKYAQGTEDTSWIIEKLNKKYPDSPEANLIKVFVLLFDENKPDEALKVLNSTRSKITSEFEINDYNMLMSEVSNKPLDEAQKLMENGYPKKALELLENENIPETPTLYCTMATCYIRLNEMQKALECLNKAMALDSKLPDVYFAFIEYYIEAGDIETARKYIEQTKTLKNEDYDNNDIIKRLDDFTKTINQMEAEKYVDNIVELYEQQRYDEAWNQIEKALNISDDISALHFYKGLIYIAKNNYAASTAEFSKSIKIDENSVLSYYYLALAFDNLGERISAYECYEKFLEVIPKDFYGSSDAIEYAKARIEKLK